MTNFNEKIMELSMELNEKIKWYDETINYQLHRTDKGASDATRAEIITMAYEQRKNCLNLLEALRTNNHQVYSSSDVSNNVDALRDEIMEIIFTAANPIEAQSTNGGMIDAEPAVEPFSDDWDIRVTENITDAIWEFIYDGLHLNIQED